MSEPPPKDLETMLKTTWLTDDIMNYVSTHIKLTEFQGFDARRMALTLWTNYKSTSPTSVGMFGELLKSKTIANFKTLIAECISIFLRRTTLITKLKERTSEEGRAIIDALIIIFKIQTTGGTQAKGPDYVTFARIAAAFPSATIQMFQSPAYYKFVGDIAQVDAQLNLGVCLPMGAYFFGYSTNADYERWLKWAYSFDAVIHSNPESGKPNPTKVKQVADAIRAAGKANLTEPETKGIWDMIRLADDEIRKAHKTKYGALPNQN